MDKQTDRQTNRDLEWINRQTDRQTDKQTDRDLEWINRQTDRQTEIWNG